MDQVILHQHLGLGTHNLGRFEIAFGIIYTIHHDSAVQEWCR